MNRQKIIDRVVMLIAILAVIFGAYFYYEWSLLKQNPQTAAQQELSDLVAKVSNLIVLPSGETPTLATVSDPTALKDPFFRNAQKGDKVLIYALAKKAILYSVLLNKIIDVAPLNIGTQQTTTPAPSAPATAKTTKKP